MPAFPLPCRNGNRIQMPPKLENGQWVKNKTKSLLDYAIKFNDDLQTLSYGSYTILKLICVSYYAEVFAKIAKGPSAKNQGYDAAVYIDLFAGPGIVSIEDTNERVVGSPLAVASSDLKFDYYVFVEKNKKNNEALGQRLPKLLNPKQYLLIHGDCNANVQSIIQHIRSRFKKPIIFAFVDPEGMEIKWDTVRQLSTNFSELDFMINVSTGASRIGGKLEAGKEGYRPIFEDYFQAKAEDILLQINKGITVQKVYTEAVQQTLGRSAGKTIPICDNGNNLMYNILGYTRQSPSGSPWANAGFGTLDQRLRDADGKLVTRILDVISGRAKSLD